MKKIFLAILVILITPEAMAKQGMMGAVRVGPSMPTQEISDSINANVGPLIDGQIGYEFEKNFSIGLEGSYETHGVDTSNIGLGSLHTVTLMPFALMRLHTGKVITPYASIGLGVNINSFSGSDVLNNSNISLNPSSSFAIKPSLGFYGAVSRAVSLNAEIGWKSNSGSVTSNAFFGSSSFNSSAIQFLFGIKF